MAKSPAERCQTPGELADDVGVSGAAQYDDPPVPRLEFKENAALIGHLDIVLVGALLPPIGSHLASGGKDGMLLYWDAIPGRSSGAFPSIRRRSVPSPSRRRSEHIASASGFTVRLYDIRGQEVRRFSGHTGLDQVPRLYSPTANA